MSDNLLVGFWRFALPVPSSIWRRQVAAMAGRLASGLRFLSRDHHRVRRFVAQELPRHQEPLPPELVARELELPVARVKTLLAQLEKGLMFLYRDEAGAVAWAYPGTVEPTPHRVTFSTGERGYAA